MTHSASFFSLSESPADTPTPLSSIGEESRGERSPRDVTDVGESRLSYSQREAAIKLAGDLVVKYMRYANDNPADYFTYRGMADRARLSMEALIKGRSADWKRPQERADL